MKKYILLISLLLYASSSNAGSLVIFNNCEYCSSIKVIVTVPATSEDPSYDVEQTLGDYGDSVAFDVPHSGTYWVKANCLSGESYSWNFSVYCSQYSNTEKFLDCAAPTTSSTSTTALTSTSTSSSTTTTSLKTSTTTTYSTEGSLTFYNYCEDCSSIRITITVPATPGNPSYEEELLLGDYYSSVAYEIPHYGYYIIRADCLEGIDYLWSFGGYYNTYLSYNKFLYCGTVINHMMTKNIENVYCGYENPIPTDTFYYYDEIAYCHSYWIGASPTDEIGCKWYEPNGDLYYEYSTAALYTSFCWWPGIYIKGYPPAYNPGNWRVEIYYEGIKKFTEDFTIIGYTSTTSTIRPTTTTTKKSTTSTIPVPVPTTTSSYISTTTIPPNICVIGRIYGEDSIEAELLRYLRDNLLSTTPEGQEIIRLYYELSPVIIKMMNEDEEFREDVREMIDGIMEVLLGEGN